MLRLFRNYLCLATVLQLGTAVQAQQNSVTSKPNIKPTPVTSTAKSNQPAISTSKPTSTTGTTSSSKSITLTTKAKPSQAATATVKTTVVSIPSKSVQSANTPAKGVVSPAKTELGAPKSAKTEPGQGTSKSAKTEPAQSASNSAKTEPAQGASKSEKTKEKVVQVKHTSSPRLGLVPPPPPDTPTIFAGDGMFPGIGASDFSNPAALAARRKDIASQLVSAKKLLADKEQRTKELKDKVIQFQSLYSEGVISRRELETTQKESDSTAAELNDSKTQTMSLQNTLARLDDRLKPKSLASSSKKKVKGKTKAALKPSVKVAGSSSVPAGKTSSVVSVKDTAKDSGAPVVHSSENMDSELSATSTKSPTQADLKH